MEKNNSFKIASVYIGTVIGAGFSSGREIIKFFTVYGRNGIYGIILATVSFCLLGSLILLKIHKYKITSYHEWIENFFGVATGKMIEGVLSLLLLSGYCVMLAGSGELFREHFRYPKEIGIIFMSIITFAIFIFSMKGLTWVNKVVVPLLLFGIIFMGSSVLLSSEWILSNEVGATVNKVTGNWMTSSLLYVSYNSIGAMMVMSSMYPLLKNKRSAIGGGLMGGLGLGLMAIFLFLPTLIFYTDIKGVEIPMMVIASKFGKEMKILYGILLWFAMLTTAIGNGFVFIQSVERRMKINHMLVCIFFCIGTTPLAKIGFKNLIDTLYPLFGYVGFFIIIFIIFRGWNEKKYKIP